MGEVVLTCLSLATVISGVLGWNAGMGSMPADQASAKNPILWADVPDLSFLRVGNDYYMSSTTMHMVPGLPIMHSTNLVDWELASYAHGVLDPGDALSLNGGKNAYGQGSWASCLRFHNGRYYVSTFSGTTNKTYILSTDDPKKGDWKAQSFTPSLHDSTLWFENRRAFMIFGAGQIRLVELKKDLSGVDPEGENRVIIENASAVAPGEIGLRAEGSQLFKVGDTYYLFHITWPKGGMRTQLVHRAKSLTGPWEGRVFLQDRGIAQGSIIDTPDGKWFTYLFGDRGAVGRIPFLAPVEGKDGWPVVAGDGKVPDSLSISNSGRGALALVASDEFDRKPGDKDFGLAWQWNHNPVDSLWSLRERAGFLRLKTDRIDANLEQARNTLTQRTFGPESSAETHLDFASMKVGDVAGLCLLQRRYGFVGVERREDGFYAVMVSNADLTPKVLSEQKLAGTKIWLKAKGDFQGQKDRGTFAFHLGDGNWQPFGGELRMRYDLPHFMGYRFGLFFFSTKEPGGSVDFDYYRVR